MQFVNKDDWSGLNAALRQLFQFMQSQLTSNLDFHQRQIKNAHPSIDDYDYVVRKELKEGISTTNANIKVQNAGQSFDKITFGLFAGSASAVLGANPTPPFIWSNPNPGSPVSGFYSVNVPPVGSTIIIDILKNGSSILGNFIMIPPGITPQTSYPFNVFNKGTFNQGDVFSVNVIQVGTTITGQGIELVIFCTL